jgi:hypothetical protein
LKKRKGVICVYSFLARILSPQLGQFADVPLFVPFGVLVFAVLKNYCIFAAFLTGTILRFFVCAAIFIAANTALHAAEIRLSISNGCCAAKPVIVPVRTERDSLSPFIYSNFSFMTGTMKNASTVNNSSLTSTSAHETGTQSISPGLADCLQKLREVFYSVLEFYRRNPEIQDDLKDKIPTIEKSLSEAAYSISLMAAAELLDDKYYKIKNEYPDF